MENLKIFKSGFYEKLKLLLVLLGVLIVGINQMRADSYTFKEGTTIYYDFTAISGGANWWNGSNLDSYDANAGGRIKAVTFASDVTADDSYWLAKTATGGWNDGPVKLTSFPTEGQNVVIIGSDGKSMTWGSTTTFNSGDKIYFKDASAVLTTLGNSYWKVASGGGKTGNVYAKFYDASAETWTYSSSGVSVDGTWNEANDIYEIEVPGSGNSYSKVVFTRGYAGTDDGTWNKTIEQPALSYNIFYINDEKSGDDWYGTWGKYSRYGSLVTSDNSWDYRSDLFDSKGFIYVDLTAGQTFDLKVMYGENQWYGCDSKSITATVNDWFTTSTSGANINITAGVAGTYIFGWDGTNKKLGVYYPEALLTKQKYIYFDIRRLVDNGNDWNVDNPSMRFYFKHYHDAHDIANVFSYYANVIEDHVYPVLVPDNDSIGRIQINDYNTTGDATVGSDGGNKTNVTYVSDRGTTYPYATNSANITKNCLQPASDSPGWSNWTPEWTTYCPPTTSETFADNSTTKISWQDEGNDGSSSSKAILVKTGTTLKVTASASKAVADGNMTVKYDFQVNSGSVTAQTSGSYTSSASTNGTVYNVKMQAYTNYNLDNTQNSTKSTTKNLYYKAVNTYSVTHTLSNVTCSSGRIGDEQAAYYQPYTATFAASTGYNLPATITVKFGSTTKTAGTDYTWTQATGVLSIPANKIDGAVTVIVDGVAKTYTVTLDENGGTAGSVTSVTATYNEYPADHVFSDLLEAGARPTKSDYYLDGWYTGTGGTGEKLIDGPTAYLAYGTGYLNEYTDASGNWIYDDDKTLYARWKANSSDDNYTFTYGSGTRYDESTWTVVALDTATNHMWQKTGFTMPDPTSKKFYVGFEEDFYRGHYLGWATPTKAQSAEVDLTSLRLAPGTQAIGTATGATGTLVLWSNSASDNLYVGFQPSGYGITYNSGTEAFAEADAANTLWETAPITLVAADVSGTFQVKLATSSSYTTCALSAIEDKDDLDGRNGERPDLATGQRGKFRIWANSSTNNFGLDFMPVYSVSFNMKGHGSAIDPYPSIDHGALIGAPSAPSQTGYSFDGWYKDEDCTDAWDFANDVVTENTTLYAKWSPVTLTFVGGYEAGEWNDTRNWTPACIPTIDHDVVLQASATLYGRFGGVSGHGRAKSIKIDKSTDARKNIRLSIWTCSSLIVAEDITAKHVGDGDFGAVNAEDLYIETTVLGNGVLICGSANANTAATYDFHSKAYKADNKWYINQYVGIPFAELDADKMRGFNIFVYDDAEDDWRTPGSNTMNPWTAYDLLCIYPGGVGNQELKGTLLFPGTGEGKTKTLSCTRRNSEEAKWTKEHPFPTSIDGTAGHQDHMFANSWTAPIDIAAMEESDFTHLVHTIYIFNAGYEGDGVRVLGDDAGQWSSFPLAAVKAGEIENAVIPATQAFLVTDTASGSSITLDYKTHVYDPAKATSDANDTINNFPTRAPRRVKKSSSLNSLKMFVRSEEDVIADRLYIIEGNNLRTDTFDNGWDGNKIMGESFAPQLYSMSGTSKMYVNAVKDMEGMKIGFKAGAENQEYTLSFDYEEQAEPLYLYDKETNAYTEITNEATYEFTTTDRKAHERFLLTRSNSPQIATGVEEIDTENVQRAQKFMQDQQIFIRRGDKVYSIDGALVK